MEENLNIEKRPQWTTLSGRLKDQENLDQAITVATAQRDALALSQALQFYQIPCGPVQDARDVLERDPQLAHRQHWVTLNHPEMGPSTYNSAPYRYSNAYAAPTSPSPLLGQHTREICRDLLGLDDAAIDQLESEGVLA